MPLTGKTAVITGGGRGIGAAVARELAGAGAAVVLAARTSAEVEAVAEELKAAGADALGVVCDVTDPDSVDGLVKQAARMEPIDILVNNAGVSSSAPLVKTSLEEWNRILAVNATGTFLCMKAFLPGMIDRGWGRVVNVASTAARAGARYVSAYAAAKHAVLGLSRCAALEVAKCGVTVNLVCPGYVDTRMTRESIARITEKTGLTEDAALKTILVSSPQERLIEPEEVAHAVRGLCEEGARGINGQCVVIDGGGVQA